jgi:D-alanyl-lipoteichoic acid acyltransferase DltB (MBOAT superfamily)
MIPGLSAITVDSLPFAILCLAMVLLAWTGERRWFLPGLAVASAVMLASWLTPLDLAALVLFLAPPYLAVRAMWGNRRFAASIAAALVIAWEVALFIYLRKYEWAAGRSVLNHPVSVIGISYMLFRAVHLIAEAPYLGHLPFNGLRFATYVLAFWTLLSGPIQRYEDFCGGLDTIGRPATADALAAGHRAVNGLIKAFLIAPILLKAADLAALGQPGAGWLDFLIVLYAYPIYLYLNFSGYTDLMIAVSRLCGMTTMPENFNRPYLARNLQDFWTRWHMSFSAWIRRYVFTPLSKWLLESTPPAVDGAMLSLAVMVTFVVVGAWHGTTANFLVFGLLHGGAIVAAGVANATLKSVLGRDRKIAFDAHPVVHGASVFLCLNYVAATVLFFPNSIADVVGAMRAFFVA